MGAKLTRRSFLKALGIGFLEMILAAAGGVGYSVLVESSQFQVENVPLKLKRLPKRLSGLRVAQLSDIHMGGWMNLDRFKEVTKLLLAENPDILLLTGDFVYGYKFNEYTHQVIEDLVEGLSPLATSIPTFAVLGNHDYWLDAEKIREMLATCGITDLTNTSFPFFWNGTRLNLCGVDDVWEGDARLDDVIALLDGNSPAILLAHEPDFADICAFTGKFDLQISGHSHGGQIVLPLVGPPILPHLGTKYHSGLYQVGEMFQYTNRGVGMGRVPVRLNCPPEITIFTLEGGS